MEVESNNSSSWITNFIDLLYKVVEWRAVKWKFYSKIILRESVTFQRLGHIIIMYTCIVFTYVYMYV